MAGDDVDTTSLTLLERLRSPGDHEAWARFARLYTPLLYYWCRRAGLAEQDAADVVQDVFVLLVKKLPEFRHDRQHSFRGWLRTVTLNKWRESRRKMTVRPVGSDSGLDNVAEMDNEWQFDEDEYRRQLLANALPLIEHEFPERQWQAFQRHVVQGIDAAEVASELGVRVGTVYAAKSKILSRLRRELAGFLDP
jgi:RNA polymerase sigma-70 factor (ECF subfamily)